MVLNYVQKEVIRADIRDCKGRLVCKVEPRNGNVETVYKRQVTKTTLAVGAKFVIERDGVQTTVTRKSNSEMEAVSCEFPT